MSENMKETLDNRGSEYGDFRSQALLAQNLKRFVRNHRTSGSLIPEWELLAPYMRESIEMILHKIARIVNGNPYNLDSWHDIAGYATIAKIRAEQDRPNPVNISNWDDVGQVVALADAPKSRWVILGYDGDTAFLRSTAPPPAPRHIFISRGSLIPILDEGIHDDED